MANNLNSNWARKLVPKFLDHFESSRVLTKTVDTQLLQGKFTPSSGANVDFKRPHDYNTIRTAGGDLTMQTKSSIIAGKATGTVQNYFTVAMDWTNVEEALELNQLDEILEPAARRLVTDVETDFGRYMYKNTGLSVGTPGTAISTWTHMANQASLMKSVGVPENADWYSVINPYTAATLASAQSGIYAESLVKTAWERAQISAPFAGLKAIASNAMPSYTTGVNADRAGTLSATPTATYVSVKDTMVQTLAVTGFAAGGIVNAGEIIEVTGRYRTNVSTRETILDAAGSPVKWRATVTAPVTLGSSGEGNLVVTGPAIFESNGQYNNVSTALTSGDVVTLLGTSATTYQPSMFYHKQAFGIGSVKLPPLSTWSTNAITSDGFSIRVTRYADGDANIQKIRFDFLPAYATFQPMFAGQGFGS